MTNVLSFPKSPFYTLDDNGQIHRLPMSEYEQLTASPMRPLFRTEIRLSDDTVVLISTVFMGIILGMDYKTNQPTIFETMIFGGSLSNSQWRYNSLGKAKMGHFEVVDSLIAEYGLTADSDQITHQHSLND